MKQSIITKQYFVHGKIKRVVGEIKITMNDRSEQSTYHNPILHEEFPVTKSYHKVQSFIDNQRISERDNIKSEEEVLSVTKHFLDDLKKQMERQANTVPEKPFEEKLNDILNS